MEVILIIQADDLEDKEIFEEYLKEEGFKPIENEPFAYHGTTTTSLIHTETFILHVVKEALRKAGFFTCKIIFQIGENEMKAFVINKAENEFQRAIV